MTHLRLVAKGFPTSDRVFLERVREIAATLEAATPEAAVAGFEAKLRPVYPTAAVHIQGDLATLDRVTTLYVFRDGTVAAKESADDWADGDETARVVSDADGIYVDANEGAARLFGIPRDEIIGRRAGDFTRPDARVTDAVALWRELNARGRLHSLAWVVCSDGTETRVEFITTRDGDGPGRNVTYMRAAE